MSNTDPTKKEPEIDSGAHDGYVVPAFYKTPAVLLIYSVKSYRSSNTFPTTKTRMHACDPERVRNSCFTYY